MEEERKKFKIMIETGKEPYIYCGYVTECEDKTFISVLDDRAGLIRLNKSKIISMQGVKE